MKGEAQGEGEGQKRRAETQGNRVLSAIIREAEAAPLRYSGNLWALPWQTHLSPTLQENRSRGNEKEPSFLAGLESSPTPSFPHPWVRVLSNAHILFEAWKRSSMTEKGTAWLTALESALTEMATTPFTLRGVRGCGGTWGTGCTQLTKSACGQTDSSLVLHREFRCEVARCDSTQALTIHLSPHHGAYLTNRLFFPLTSQGSSPLF